MNLTRSDTMEDLDTQIDGENLVFSKDQIEYLRSEFERQRQWVNLLSTREQAALKELEETKNSISYKVGRFLTHIPRKLLPKGSKTKKKNVYFVDEQDEVQEELFPSTLLISPELLPSSAATKKADFLVEDILIAVRRGRITVNSVRDMFSEGSFSLPDSEQLSAGVSIMNHLLSSPQYTPSVRNVYVGILRSLANSSGASGLEFGEKFFDELLDQRAVRTLIQLHGRQGNFSRPLELLARMPNDAWKKKQLNRFKEAADIQEKGLNLKSPKTGTLEQKANAIVYYASQSLPHTSSGYAIRTHGLISSMVSKGYNIDAVLRNGYPLDRNDFMGTSVNEIEIVDDVKYHFNSKESSSLINYQEVYNFNKFREYQRQATEHLIQHAKLVKPSLIHSASNFVVGLAGARAAKALGIPSIYEIRGFWHLTQSTKRQGYESSDHYNLSEHFEIETAKQSDYVFTITQALKDILVEKGVQDSKIRVLPNAVDASRFKIMKKDKDLEKDLGFKNKLVIGYIGSFVDYEGLDLLLEACALLKESHGGLFKLLLVGDGQVMQQLRRTVQFLQLEEHVVFTGRISHDEVQRYYSLIDIAPLPRKGLRVCELVSPLKPFEAMASGKVLITSSVQALAEIVDDGTTGLVFEKDNAKDLAAKLELVLLDADLRKKIGENANKWVLENHSWDVISKRVTDIYDKILEENK